MKKTRAEATDRFLIGIQNSADTARDNLVNKNGSHLQITDAQKATWLANVKAAANDWQRAMQNIDPAIYNAAVERGFNKIANYTAVDVIRFGDFIDEVAELQTHEADMKATLIAEIAKAPFSVTIADGSFAREYTNKCLMYALGKEHDVTVEATRVIIAKAVLTASGFGT